MLKLNHLKMPQKQLCAKCCHLYALLSLFRKASTPGQSQTRPGPKVYSFTIPGCHTASIRYWQ